MAFVVSAAALKVPPMITPSSSLNAIVFAPRSWSSRRLGTDRVVAGAELDDDAAAAPADPAHAWTHPQLNRGRYVGKSVLRAGLIVVLAAVVLGAGAGSSSGARGIAPAAAARCYGAADRDPARPCTNPALRRRVTPAPRDALLIPDAPCTREPDAGLDAGATHGDARAVLCSFGAEPSVARRTIALLGDSHASSWRAALIAAGAPEQWRGVSLTRNSCPFSLARPRVGPGARANCLRWNRDVIAWLTAHPEVRDVFVSAHSGAPVLRDRGRTALASKLTGYAAAWVALPPTVRRVFVLRDGPTQPSRTADCIEAALAARRPSIPRCAVRRAGSLLPDPQAVSARRLRSPRVRVIDLTPFMCGPRLCYPVVGGVLVNKDTNHLSREFSTTLGPYLLRRARPWLTPASPPPGA